MANSAFNLDENIIAKLGLQDMPEDQRIALLDQMSDLVEKRAMLRIMEELPEDSLDEANRQADDPEKLMEFLATKVNILDIIAEETEKLKNELFQQASRPTADEVAEAPEPQAPIE